MPTQQPVPALLDTNGDTYVRITDVEQWLTARVGPRTAVMFKAQMTGLTRQSCVRVASEPTGGPE